MYPQSVNMVLMFLYVSGYRKKERKNILKMGCANGFTFAIGYVIILIAHMLSIITHISLGNELIVSKVSYTSLSTPTQLTFTCSKSIIETL